MALIAVASSAVFAGAQRGLSIFGLKDVSGREFEAPTVSGRALLVFVSSRAYAKQSRAWGDALDHHYGSAIAPWDQSNGQAVLVVPVLELSGMEEYAPKSLIRTIVRDLGGENDVLVDWKGRVRTQLENLQGRDLNATTIVLLGPDLQVQTMVVGDYSAASARQLFSAIDADLKLHPLQPSTLAGRPVSP